MSGAETRMRIGELASHIGSTPRALRHYEQQGLLAPTRERNGYRVYDEVAVVRAANIKALLAAGLTTADVSEYLEEGCLDRPLTDSPRCAEELATAQNRIEHLDDLLARLQETRERLAHHHASLASQVDESDLAG
ncbi:MerR family transcriptional regulator [Aeromicrobium phragmitis]|nr:MerR family transcriptional regulator [Aeromicrobium phragmitis]